MQGAALDVLETLIEATYTRQRAAHLAKANLGLEKLRFLCRLQNTRHTETEKPPSSKASQTQSLLLDHMRDPMRETAHRGRG